MRYRGGVTKRNDLRATQSYLRSNPAAAFFMAAVCVLAGVASLLGYLRAQSAPFQWGLALVAWGFAIFCVASGVRGLRER